MFRPSSQLHLLSFVSVVGLVPVLGAGHGVVAESGARVGGPALLAGRRVVVAVHRLRAAAPGLRPVSCAALCVLV